MKTEHTCRAVQIDRILRSLITKMSFPQVVILFHRLSAVSAMILIFQERLYFNFSRNANQAQQFQNHYDKHLLYVGE